MYSEPLVGQFFNFITVDSTVLREEKTLNNFLDVYSVSAQARMMANHSLVDFVTIIVIWQIYTK